MSFITKISTNIKSPDGEEYTANIGKNTLLIGNNESGKSAIAEALQLARTGSVFGLLYRDKPIKDGSLLSALIPPTEEAAQAIAQLENGEVCQWTLKRGKRATRTGPNGIALSIAELHGVMAGSLETQTKFFWSALCEKISISDLMDQIPKELHETLILVCPVDKPVDLSGLLSRVGSLQRDQSAQVKASQIALESMGIVRAGTEDELGGVWNSLQRAILRDLLKTIYLDYRADPALQAGHVLAHLTEQLGGKEAIQRSLPSDEILGEIGETLLHRRMTRVAILAKDGEIRASNLRSSLKDLKTAFLKVMHDALDGAADAICKKVGSFLPKNEALVFEPSGGSLTIGLSRQKEKHTALSGSTEARLLAAIASGLSDGSSLIVVDDRMWDPLTLGKTMEVLEKAPCQVVVMSTIKPRGRKRSAWNYVEVARTPGKPLEVNDGQRKELGKGGQSDPLSVPEQE